MAFEDAGVDAYVELETTTGDAVITYAPGTRFNSVVVAVTIWLNPPGPVTLIAAGPLGRPLTVIAKLPLAIAYATEAGVAIVEATTVAFADAGVEA